MKSSTAIVVCTGIVAVTVIAAVIALLVVKSKKDAYIWGTKPYSASDMNSLLGAINSVATEGGAGNSAW